MNRTYSNKLYLPNEAQQAFSWITRELSIVVDQSYFIKRKLISRKPNKELGLKQNVALLIVIVSTVNSFAGLSDFQLPGDVLCVKI